MRMDLTAFIMSYKMIVQESSQAVPDNIQHRWDGLSYDDLFNQVLFFHNCLCNKAPPFFIAIYKSLIDKLVDSKKTMQAVVLIYNLAQDKDEMPDEMHAILDEALDKLDTAFEKELGFYFTDSLVKSDNPSPPLSRTNTAILATLP